MLHQSPTTIPSEIRDFSEWHHGRESYAVWILRCDVNKDIQEKFKSAQEHLNGYLLEAYRRQPHITLFVCGFLVEEPQYNDDFIQAQLDAQIQALEKAHIRSFEIEIGDMNSFTSAPFFEVRDPDGGIPRLRENLSQGASEFRTAPYVPHLTIGLYADTYPSEEILQSMDTFSSEPIRWTVEQITLATFQAKECAEILRYPYDFRLES